MDERGFSAGLADVSFADGLEPDVRSNLCAAFQRETRDAAARAMALRRSGRTPGLGVPGEARSQEDERCALGELLSNQSSTKALQTIFKARFQSF